VAKVDSLERLAVEFVAGLQAAGLAEKARTVLAAVTADPKTEDGVRILSQRAGVEAELCSYAAAAATYVELAHSRRKSDVDGRLAWLRKAAEVAPDDPAIGTELDDLATGRTEQRRKARKRRR